MVEQFTPEKHRITSTPKTNTSLLISIIIISGVFAISRDLFLPYSYIAAIYCPTILTVIIAIRYFKAEKPILSGTLAGVTYSIFYLIFYVNPLSYITVLVLFSIPAIIISFSLSIFTFMVFKILKYKIKEKKEANRKLERLPIQPFKISIIFVSAITIFIYLFLKNHIESPPFYLMAIALFSGVIAGITNTNITLRKDYILSNTQIIYNACLTGVYILFFTMSISCSETMYSVLQEVKYYPYENFILPPHNIIYIAFSFAIYGAVFFGGISVVINFLFSWSVLRRD